MAKIRVTQVLEATVGGTGKHLRELVTHLDPERFEVSVICSLERDPAYGAAVEGMKAVGARVDMVQMTREVSPAADRRAFGEIRRILRELRPDIVHAHSSKAGFLARLAARAAGIRAAIYTPHCFAFQMEASPLRLAAYRRLEWLAGRWTTRLIAVSQEERRLAVEAGICPVERVVFLPNGLDPSELDDQLPREDARRQLGIPREQFVVGAVGRLCAQKAPQDFVRAAQEAERQGEEIRFIWIGGGELEQAMRDLVTPLERERITFAGERADAVRLYRAFDVFVLSSRWEGCPYAALEAGASGLPVVATAAGGVRDIVLDGETGILVPPGQPDELARAVISLYNDEARRRAMGESGRARIREEFNIERHIRAMEQLYEEVAAG